MFLLFFLLPLGGLELFAPVILWIVAAPRWHRLLAVIYGALGFVALLVWINRLRRDSAERRQIAATHATWRWSRGFTPDGYRARLVMFLQLRGWHVESSAVTERGRVELLARRDRHSLLLLCVGPQQAPMDNSDVLHADEARTHHRASRAIIVSQAAVAMQSGALGRVHQFRFTDLQQLEQRVEVLAGT